MGSSTFQRFRKPAFGRALFIQTSSAKDRLSWALLISSASPQFLLKEAKA